MFFATRIVCAAGCVWSVAGVVITMKTLFRMIPENYSGWTMGQVVALCVWAPVISKYLYLLTVGIEKGFKIRLPRVYKLVRNDGDDVEK